MGARKTVRSRTSKRNQKEELTMNKEQLYAAIDEYEGGFVGTLSEIQEWMEDKNISLSSCELYEVGRKVEVFLSIVVTPED